MFDVHQSSYFILRTGDQLPATSKPDQWQAGFVSIQILYLELECTEQIDQIIVDSSVTN